MNALTTKKEEVKTVATSASVATVAKNGKTENAKNDVLQGKKEVLDKIFTPTTADDRLKNLNLFQKLAEKHNFLKDKADTLNAYMIGRDGMKEKLSIKSDCGMEFQISNSNIIEEILILCTSKLDKMMEESNTQILTFNI
ncbi:hypothetical protein [Elizabethkingia ursingii]|uniref:Uncharacterized protein n=1 Tax=Elizabethkingia ursingii TaxID=1756150 RepID=A0AAJ3NAL4_9FLAO|nr:hypothetical protein [Elizabethkingia ursingii]AQX08049.1 hypothetical protein BBD34_05040 [Elizabethkingia ursingii]OPB73597.1 hypothetical protein BAY32_11180 [Elizabethkingia ursingii]